MLTADTMDDYEFETFLLNLDRDIDPATDAGLFDGLPTADEVPEVESLPARESMRRHVLTGYGCCAAHGGARCRGTRPPGHKVGRKPRTAK